jgi:DNA-binding MarR family transcriptional regulator
VSRESKDELFQELLRLAREEEAANDAFDEVASRKLGINRTDMRCLNIVENQGRITAGRLAELSGLTTAAVTAVLDRLEGAGYARRVRHDRDRRQVLVEVTPLLKERGEKIWGPIAEDARRRVARMTVAEMKTVMDFYRETRDLNMRHVERVRNLDFD